MMHEVFINNLSKYDWLSYSLFVVNVCKQTAHADIEQHVWGAVGWPSGQQIENSSAWEHECACRIQNIQLMSRLHQDTCCRIQVVSTCIHLSPSTCILCRRQNCRQFVARLLLDTKWYMNSMSLRYSLQVSRTSNMYPSTYMYPDTSCSSGIHVSGWHVSWCKRGSS